MVQSQLLHHVHRVHPTENGPIKTDVSFEYIWTCDCELDDLAFDEFDIVELKPGSFQVKLFANQMLMLTTVLKPFFAVDIVSRLLTGNVTFSARLVTIERHVNDVAGDHREEGPRLFRNTVRQYLRAIGRFMVSCADDETTEETLVYNASLMILMICLIAFHLTGTSFRTWGEGEDMMDVLSKYIVTCSTKCAHYCREVVPSRNIDVALVQYRVWCAIARHTLGMKNNKHFHMYLLMQDGGILEQLERKEYARFLNPLPQLDCNGSGWCDTFQVLLTIASHSDVSSMSEAMVRIITDWFTERDMEGGSVPPPLTHIHLLRYRRKLRLSYGRRRAERPVERRGGDGGGGGGEALVQVQDLWEDEGSATMRPKRITRASKTRPRTVPEPVPKAVIVPQPVVIRYENGSEIDLDRERDWGRLRQEFEDTIALPSKVPWQTLPVTIWKPLEQCMGAWLRFRSNLDKELIRSALTDKHNRVTVDSITRFLDRYKVEGRRFLVHMTNDLDQLLSANCGQHRIASVDYGHAEMLHLLAKWAGLRLALPSEDELPSIMPVTETFWVLVVDRGGGSNVKEETAQCRARQREIKMLERKHLVDLLSSRFPGQIVEGQLKAFLERTEPLLNDRELVQTFHGALHTRIRLYQGRCTRLVRSIPMMHHSLRQLGMDLCQALMRAP